MNLVASGVNIRSDSVRREVVLVDQVGIEGKQHRAKGLRVEDQAKTELCDNDDRGSEPFPPRRRDPREDLGNRAMGIAYGMYGSLRLLWTCTTIHDSEITLIGLETRTVSEN